MIKKIILLMIISINTLLSCQPAMGWIAPSNYELVKEAKYIALVQITKELKGDSKYYPFSQISAKVLKSIKGDIKQKKIFLKGYIDYEGRSPEGDFSRARAGAYSGMCRAYDYKLRGTFLVFLNEKNKILPTIGGRVNEEVSTAKSPWVKAVSSYVKIASLNNDNKEKEALYNILNSTTISGLKEDIRRHFNK